LTKGLLAVADALNEGETARAMIAAVQLKLPPLDWHGAVRILRAENALAKYNFNPTEPRDWHGRWTTGDDSTADAAAPAAPLRYFDESSPSPSVPLVGGKWPAPPGAGSNPLFYPTQAEEDENGRGGLLSDFRDLPGEFRQGLYEGLRARLRDIDPGNRALQTLTPPDHSPSQAEIDELNAALLDAQERAGEPPATAWDLGWGARGVQL
jgi:hypothetical protein